ncbi:unnamed protein product [Closterium sp. Naga37s-1]|nr:unnamed protein product [Closterium sp. Naga37s-1]
MGPGIWRMPSADTAKPGMEKVTKAVTEKHQAGDSGNFGSLLTKLKAALRRYVTEERKRVHASLRHLEPAVSGLQQELMRRPHRDDLPKKGPVSRWDFAQEQLVFNRHVLLNGKKPLGRQAAAKGLELIKIGDFVGRADDGTRLFKDEKVLAKELGTLKKARRALKTFGSVPASWKEKLLAPITGAEFLAESSYVKKLGAVGVWKVEKRVQEGLACQACDCFGVPLVRSAETTAVLDLDKVEPLMVRNGRVIGVCCLPEVRLRCSELCMEDRIPPFKHLRMFFGAQQGVMRQQGKWTEEWGKVIDWK